AAPSDRPGRQSVRFETETDLQRDLEMRDLAIDDVAARSDHFEPVDVADRLGCGFNRLADRRVRSFTGRTDDFYELIHVIRHDLSSSVGAQPGPASSGKRVSCASRASKPRIDAG